jgi:hypothetical protein
MCEDCGACYQEHTMKLLDSIMAQFTIKSKSITRIFSIEEIRGINSYQDLEKLLEEK